MEAELAGLAVSGATTLVGLMASDGWDAVKSRVAAVLRRGRPGEEHLVEGELADDLLELTAAQQDGDQAAVADLEAVWRRRLRRLLTQDPAAATALRELIAEAAGESGPGGVHNTISGGEFHGTVVQTGTVNGGLTFN